MMPRITRPDSLQNVWYVIGYGGNGVSFSTWAGKRIAERVAGKDAGQEVFNLLIYNSPLEFPNVFNAVRSEAFAPFRRFVGIPDDRDRSFRRIVTGDSDLS